MINGEFIRSLKQTNVSVDAEKTKARTTSAWRSAPREVQKTILDLAGVSRTTIHRAYKMGTISAKLTLSMAQVLNMDPFYFTGETDSPGECGDELLKQFLERHGYGKVSTLRASGRSKTAGAKTGRAAKAGKAAKNAKSAKSAQSAGRSRTAGRSEKPAAPDAQIGEASVDSKPKAAPDEAEKGSSRPKANDAQGQPASPADAGALTLAGALTEEEMILLMKSVLLRAKAGGKYAEIAEKLKLLLITY
jgi:hypothetical protein